MSFIAIVTAENRKGISMINVRTYLQKKAERKAGEAQSRDFGALIQKHRLAVFDVICKSCAAFVMFSSRTTARKYCKTRISIDLKAAS